MTGRIFALICALLLAPSDGAAAQNGPGVISGAVIDAISGLPLVGSTVILRLVEEGTLVSTGSGAPSILAVARQTTTGDDGRYRFTGLAPARYELRAQRMGYLPATIVVELRGDAGSLVSLGLSVAPVRLQPVPINADAAIAFNALRSGAGSAAPDDARIRAARARQRAFAGTDVREITDADVLEAVTLGETDLLRALQRLPGVDTFGDYTAELWTRGGRWDETRVYFDGVPLYTPMHTTNDLGGGTTISGIGTDVIGGALLFPGVRPASIGEGAAAVLDLRSRPSVADGELRGLAEVTLLSGRLALSRGARDGHSGWSLAGRHAVGDLFRTARGEGLLSGKSRQYFDDLTGRWERVLESGTHLQVSGVFSRDVDVQHSDPDGAFRRRDVVRNLGLVATVAREFAGMRVTQRAGASAFDLDASTNAYPLIFETAQTTKGDTVGSRILHLSLAGEVEPVAQDGTSTWRAGYELTHQQLRNRGFARLLRDTTWTEQRLERQATLPVAAFWGEYRWLPRGWLRVDGGLRVESSASIQGTPAVRPLPRLQIRAAIDSSTSISAGVGRSYLYTQATPTGWRYSAPTPGVSRWRLADSQTPALRADIATLGAERWAGDSWLLSATAYARRSTGVLLRDPRVSDFSVDTTTPVGTTRARGIELSARRLAGRLTGSLAYTIASARASSVGLEYPADQERPRSVDATALFRATSRLQLGAAYTRMSGRRFTSVLTYSLYDSTGRRLAFEQRPGDRNALRGSPYESLDLLADWSGTAWGARTGIFFQLRNVTGRPPSNRYDPVLTSPCTAPAPFNRCLNFDQESDARIYPFTPMLGVRVAF